MEEDCDRRPRPSRPRPRRPRPAPLALRRYDVGHERDHVERARAHARLHRGDPRRVHAGWGGSRQRGDPQPPRSFAHSQPLSSSCPHVLRVLVPRHHCVRGSRQLDGERHPVGVARDRRGAGLHAQRGRRHPWVGFGCGVPRSPPHPGGRRGCGAGSSGGEPSCVVAASSPTSTRTRLVVRLGAHQRGLRVPPRRGAARRPNASSRAGVRVRRLPPQRQR